MDPWFEGRDSAGDDGARSRSASGHRAGGQRSCRRAIHGRRVRGGGRYDGCHSRCTGGSRQDESGVQDRVRSQQVRRGPGVLPHRSRAVLGVPSVERHDPVLRLTRCGRAQRHALNRSAHRKGRGRGSGRSCVVRGGMLLRCTPERKAGRRPPKLRISGRNAAAVYARTGVGSASMSNGVEPGTQAGRQLVELVGRDGERR